MQNTQNKPRVNKPKAIAYINGGKNNPDLLGEARFYSDRTGTKIWIEVYGLPKLQDVNNIRCESGFFGLHIHEGNNCSFVNSENPFPGTGGHYNPDQMQHPFHTGDLPPLLGNNGYAFMVVYTSRFIPEEVIGKSIVIHSGPDDFHSQPSGDSGAKIACGQIKKYLN